MGGKSAPGWSSGTRRLSYVGPMMAVMIAVRPAKSRKRMVRTRSPRSTEGIGTVSLLATRQNPMRESVEEAGDRRHEQECPDQGVPGPVFGLDLLRDVVGEPAQCDTSQDERQVSAPGESDQLDQPIDRCREVAHGCRGGRRIGPDVGCGGMGWMTPWDRHEGHGDQQDWNRTQSSGEGLPASG